LTVTAARSNQGGLLRNRPGAPGRSAHGNRLCIDAGDVERRLAAVVEAHRNAAETVAQEVSAADDAVQCGQRVEEEETVVRPVIDPARR
jgi:hypothetical protein